MLTLILCGVILLILFWYVAILPMSYWTKRGVKQGTPCWLIGDSYLHNEKSVAEVVEIIYSRFFNCRYSGMYQLTKPMLVIHDPELLKRITVKDFDHFVDHRPIIPENADPLWSRNLGALTGQRWKDMRRILSPFFTSGKMRQMFVLMSECSEVLSSHFLAKNQKIVEVELKDIFTRYGNDVIASAAFGVKVDSLAKPNNKFYLMGKKVTDFRSLKKNLKFAGYMMIPKLLKLLNIKFFSEELRQFFQNLISETIRIREERKIVRPDMIHLLLEARKENNKHNENGLIDTGFVTAGEANIEKANSISKAKNISDLEIAAQAMVFFMAGFDTSTTLMCFMAYELAIQPEIQNRLRQEIKETKKLCGGNLNSEELMKMKYMDMVVSETLRKWPSAATTDRICTKPYTIQPENPDEKPLVLEKGTLVWIPIMGFHRDPKYYTNPGKFDPERFNDENKSHIHPYTYFPFGLGPRNCIGSRFALLEAKTLFFHLLSNFEIIPIKTTAIPVKLCKKGFQLAIEGGFNLGLKRIVKN